MRFNIDIQKKFNLRRIKFDLHKELNKGGFIIRQDHIDRLDRGLGVDGRGMKPLAPGTIQAKGHDQILVDTDKMRRLNVKKATPQKQLVEIAPGDKRKYPNTNLTAKDIGGFHQAGGRRLPKREWFGISKTAEKRVIKMVESKINREFRNAWTFRRYDDHNFIQPNI